MFNRVEEKLFILIFNAFILGNDNVSIIKLVL